MTIQTTISRKTLARGGLLSAVSSLALTVSGCLVNRVSSVQQQFCDFESNFTVQLADYEPEFSPSVQMHEPVILDKDVLWLTDSKPTRTIATQDGSTMVWEMQKSSDAPVTEDPFAVTTHFLLHGSEQRLAGISIDPRFGTVLNPDLLDSGMISSGAESICSTSWGLGTRDFSMDIDPLILEDLPSRQAILEWLGSPTTVSEEGRHFHYEYVLVGDNTDPLTVNFSIWFDDRGETPILLESSYSHFFSRADFINGKLTLELSLWQS